MQWRFATAQDARLLAELNHQLIADEGHGNPMDANQLEQRMLDWLKSEYQAVLFQRELDVLAYALYRSDEYGRIHLRQFFVDRNHRRQGVGREAMHLFRAGVVPGGKRIVVEVLTANAAARSFWAANGFREYAVTLERAPGEDPSA
jgi:ribosomal protein S18 acetylase RimI-like enzyme